MKYRDRSPNQQARWGRSANQPPAGGAFWCNKTEDAHVMSKRRKKEGWVAGPILSQKEEMGPLSLQTFRDFDIRIRGAPRASGRTSARPSKRQAPGNCHVPPGSPQEPTDERIDQNVHSSSRALEVCASHLPEKKKTNTHQRQSPNYADSDYELLSGRRSQD